MRPWPDSLVGRTVLVLLAGVLLSNVVGLVVYAGERRDLLTSARGRELAQRLATAATALEEARPEQRPRLVRQFDGRSLRMGWSQAPLAEPGPAD
ncbi:MAG: hypothetical protein ACFCUO_10900, partial [Rhodospirillales bacterium]